MSLRSTADKLALKALKIFKDFQEPVRYERITGTPSYNVELDQMTVTKKTYDFSPILAEYSEGEQAPNYSATALYTGAEVKTQKCWLIVARLAVAKDFDPNVGDVVTRKNGEVWRVFRADNPPGASVYEMVIERVR